LHASECTDASELVARAFVTLNPIQRALGMTYEQELGRTMPMMKCSLAQNMAFAMFEKKTGTLAWVSIATDFVYPMPGEIVESSKRADTYLQLRLTFLPGVRKLRLQNR